MNIDKFTAASRSVLSTAQMIAAKNNHQQILPLHFLSALLSEENNIIANLINMAGSDIQPIWARCEEELLRIPSVEVSGGGQISMSSEALKILEKSLSLAKASKDSFVTIERLFEELTYDNTTACKILQESGIDTKKYLLLYFPQEKVAEPILNQQKKVIMRYLNMVET